MEITVKLTNQDVAAANTSDLLELTRYLQGIALDAEGKTAKQEEPAKEPIKKQKAKKESAKKEEPVKEEAPTEPEASAEVPQEPEEPSKQESTTEETEAPKTAKVIDLADMKKRVMAIKDEDNNKWDGIKELIKQYGNGKLSAIPEEDREAFMSAVEAL